MNAKKSPQPETAETPENADVERSLREAIYREVARIERSLVTHFMPEHCGYICRSREFPYLKQVGGESAEAARRNFMKIITPYIEEDARIAFGLKAKPERRKPGRPRLYKKRLHLSMKQQHYDAFKREAEDLCLSDAEMFRLMFDVYEKDRAKREREAEAAREAEIEAEIALEKKMDAYRARQWKYEQAAIRRRSNMKQLG